MSLGNVFISGVYSPGSAKLTYETQFKAQAQTQFNLSCNSA